MINNLITVFYMLMMLAIAIISNTVLGAVIANRKEEFDVRKLFRGIIKSILIAFCMWLLCVTLELLPIILNEIGIEISNDLITIMEVVSITLTAYKKYAVDCVDKFKIILNIKESE